MKTYNPDTHLRLQSPSVPFEPRRAPAWLQADNRAAAPSKTTKPISITHSSAVAPGARHQAGPPISSPDSIWKCTRCRNGTRGGRPPGSEKVAARFQFIQTPRVDAGVMYARGFCPGDHPGRAWGKGWPEISFSWRDLRPGARADVRRDELGADWIISWTFPGLIKDFWVHNNVTGKCSRLNCYTWRLGWINFVFATIWHEFLTKQWKLYHIYKIWWVFLLNQQKIISMFVLSRYFIITTF